MSETTNEHQHSLLKAEAEQTDVTPISPFVRGEIDDGSNHEDVALLNLQPVKKSILLIKTVITLSVLAVLLGSISIITKQFKPASSMVGMKGMEGMPMEEMMRVDGASNPTPVKVESIQPGLMQASVRYTGSVRPYLEVTVYPRVGGQLNEYSAYPGNQVKAGQVLARLSAPELSNEVEGAMTEAEAAKADERATRKDLEEQRQEIERMAAESVYLEARVHRTQEVLLNSGAISRNEFDRQRSEATAAQAATRGARIKLEHMQAQIAKSQAIVAQAQVKIQRLKVIEGYKIITSPIGGIVQERMADPGVVVQPGMGILKIGNYSKVRLQANVAQQNFVGIEVGSPIVARVLGNSTKTFKGKVTSIFPKAGEETRTVTVEAVVDNPDGQILAGQAIEMQIITASKQNTLSVPQAAVTESEGKQAVWVVENKLAKRKFITLGLTSGDRIEVTSGLQPGALVVSSPSERLIENSPLAAVDDSGQPVASLSSATLFNTRIKLVSPQGKAVAGDNQLVLEVQDSQTLKPVPVESLEVSVAMPMKNASPMSTDVEVKRDPQPGRFQVKTYLGMRGNWDVSAKVKDSSRQGNSSFTLDNR